MGADVVGDAVVGGAVITKQKLKTHIVPAGVLEDVGADVVGAAVVGGVMPGKFHRFEGGRCCSSLLAGAAKRKDFG